MLHTAATLRKRGAHALAWLGGWRLAGEGSV